MRKAVQVVGELLITAGIILVLFVVWEMWWTNVEADSRQGQVLKQFAQELPAQTTQPNPSTQTKDFGAPKVGTAPQHGQTIGVIYIPRFGANYTRPLIEGTSADVLDTLGLGHYPSTSMPGALGNFAFAGHRQTHGAVLDNIHTLVPGDRIYVQTKDGYYTYVYRNTEVVLPNRSDVLLPTPTEAGVAPTERVLTITSCNPRFGSQERIIAYSVMESWRPASVGPPVEISKQVAALKTAA